MVAAGLCVIAAALMYWRNLQGTPQYVALRSARALFGDVDRARGLPWQPEEFEVLGITEDRAVEVLGEIRNRYLRDARIVSKGEFLTLQGKDAYRFEVEVEPGLVVPATVVVINENGRGLVQFGDLVLTYRVLIYEANKKATGVADRSVLNDVSRLLVSSGVEGYYQIPYNRVDPWPIVEPTVAERSQT